MRVSFPGFLSLRGTFLEGRCGRAPLARLAVLAAALLASAPPAWSQAAEITFTVGQSVFTADSSGGLVPGFGQPPEEVTVDDGIRIGARLSFNSWGFFGQELSYAFQSSGMDLRGADFMDLSVQNYFYNLVAHATPSGTPIRPFATAGVGASTFFPEGTSALRGGGTTKFGFNYGAGVKVKLSDRFGVRFDVRDHVTGKPFDLIDNDGALHNVEYSAGFSLLF